MGSVSFSTAHVQAYQKNIFFYFYFGELRLVCGWEFLNRQKKTELNSVHGKRVRNGLFEMAEPYLGSKYFFFFKYSLHYSVFDSRFQRNQRKLNRTTQPM